MAKTIRRKPNWAGRKPFSEMSAAEKVRGARMALERLSRDSRYCPPQFVTRSVARWESTLRGLGVEP